ncbi:hypothetical protein DdX_08682 [Ditylenchus destructor]|uniref:Uncharacterized protein n=1 Tax=Ditylenchus destructor TaxID=166010 RepID=A0AAD4N847_9BILA|nr:hypothetical protein DdX_08682 [Ditylenchus destructor]
MLCVSYLLIFAFKKLLNYAGILPYSSVDEKLAPLLQNQISSKELRPEFQNEYYVVLSAVRDVSQLFMAPLTVLAWQNLGAHSLVFLIGTPAEFEKSRATQYIADFLTDLGARTFFISSKSIPDDVLAQVVRLFAAGTPRTFNFENETVLITAHTNIIPMEIDDHTLNPGEKLKIYDSECCGVLDGVRQYSLNTISMSVREWRALMGIDKYEIPDGNTLYGYLKNEFGESLPKLLTSTNMALDRQLISAKVEKWRQINSGSIKEVKKSPLTLDMESWLRETPAVDRLKVKISTYDELQLSSNLHIKENWMKAMPILNQTFGGNIVTLLNEYREEVDKLLSGKAD